MKGNESKIVDCQIFEKAANLGLYKRQTESREREGNEEGVVRSEAQTPFGIVVYEIQQLCENWNGNFLKTISAKQKESRQERRPSPSS